METDYKTAFTKWERAKSIKQAKYIVRKEKKEKK